MNKNNIITFRINDGAGPWRKVAHVPPVAVATDELFPTVHFCEVTFPEMFCKCGKCIIEWLED